MKSIVKRAVMVCGILGLLGIVVAAEPKVTITSNFPGGNAIVVKNEGATVQIAPDLRGGKPWFYWYFEASTDQPARVTFSFTGAFVGMQGPAISTDLGKTWQWMGAPTPDDGKAFSYDFAKAGEKVRFAVTLPYLQSDLDAFLKENEGNKYLTVGVLTKSRKGRNVELLQIGQPGPGVKAVLLSARHHACETIASYVLEGFVTAAMSDTPEGVEFRKNYVLYVVPFVDKDGVEDGDQGKDRAPHDHNRDYGDGSIFPEVDAIEKLADDKNILLQQDLHCPTLRMKDHQVMHFVGTKQVPANNEKNVKEFARLIKENLPPNSPVGPLVWLQVRQPQAKGSNCNRWFSFRKGIIMASTLEIPYAPPKANMAPSRVREMGQAMLKAWVKAKFVADDAAQ